MSEPHPEPRRPPGVVAVYAGLVLFIVLFMVAGGSVLFVLGMGTDLAYWQAMIILVLVCLVASALLVLIGWGLVIAVKQFRRDYGI